MIKILKTPARNLSLNNVSFWGAAFNPQVFELKREDYTVTGVTIVEIETLRIDIEEVLTEAAAEALIDTTIKVKTGLQQFTAIVDNVGIQLDHTEITVTKTSVHPVDNTGGYMNATGLRKNFKVETRIFIDDQIVIARHTPDLNDVVRIDLQAYLKAFTSSVDRLDFNMFSMLDADRFEKYNVSFSEFFNNTTIVAPAVDQDFFIVHAALQFTKYGSNMAEYVPFLQEYNDNKKSKFLTHIKEPVFNPGFPMDLSFIISEEFAGKTVFCRYATLDVNRTAFQGLASSFLLANPEDTIKINAADNLMISTPLYVVNVAQSPGVWRMPILDNLLDAVHYIEVYLYYINNAGEVIRISEIKTLKVNRESCLTDGIYLKWLNLLGGWDFQLFDFSAEYSIDVSQTFVDRLVLDYETQRATQDVLSKSGQQKIRIGKDGVTAENMKDLSGMLYSTKVEMLSNPNPYEWRTVIVDTKGTMQYDTFNFFGDFETTIKLLPLNIQTA